jgi:hypothetical protein
VIIHNFSLPLSCLGVLIIFIVSITITMGS